MMSFYFIDDDKNITNILKIIINTRGLGVCCGSAETAVEALVDLPVMKPDIILVDFLMPEMDGITFVKQAKKVLPDAAYIMLSQVSSKDMIASAYEAGIEFFIQKPINSVEVESVIRKVSDGLAMKRMVQQMNNLFAPATEHSSTKVKSVGEKQIEDNLRTILTRLGIIGETGSKDIITIVKYICAHPGSIDTMTVSELCSKFCDNPKSMEQRIRRTAFNGLVNLAHLGLDDYSNEIFVEYSSTLYNFEQVRKEMDFICQKIVRHGNVKLRHFLTSLAFYCQNAQ